MLCLWHGCTILVFQGGAVRSYLGAYRPADSSFSSLPNRQDPHTGSEVVQEYGANDFIVIPARTPHMFEFLEDNYLLECELAAAHFQRMQLRVDMCCWFCARPNYRSCANLPTYYTACVQGGTTPSKPGTCGHGCKSECVRYVRHKD